MKRPAFQIYLLLSVFLLVLIWGNSLQPVSTSDALSLGILAKFQIAFQHWFGIAFPLSNHLLRKLAHFSEFLLYGLFLTLTFLAYGAKQRYALPYTLYLGLLTAVFDETIQYFSPGRGPHVTDVLIDHSGFCCGLLLALLLNPIFYKWFLKKRGFSF